MPKCAACGAKLEPHVRVPHTVYVKSLYRIGGQDYCRHHIIRGAVAAGLITEVKLGAGPMAVLRDAIRRAGEELRRRDLVKNLAARPSNALDLGLTV